MVSKNPAITSSAYIRVSMSSAYFTASMRSKNYNLTPLGLATASGSNLTTVLTASPLFGVGLLVECYKGYG